MIHENDNISNLTSPFEQSLYRVVTKAVEDVLNNNVDLGELKENDRIENSEFIGSTQAMQLLGIKRTKFQELLKQEALPAYRIGRKYRFKKSELIQFLESA